MKPKLIIDSKEVSLPSNFSFELNEDNTLLTASGTWTLDININISDSHNASIFGHIDRRTNQLSVKKFDCILIDKSLKRYAGTLIWKSNTQTTAVFQFVAGRSELNSFMSEETKIYELNWPKINAIDFIPLVSINGFYENGKFGVCAPVMIGERLLNNWKFYTLNSNPDDYVPLDTNFTDSDYAIQPFILYYINKLPELLGYTLKYNVLNSNELAKKIYMLSGKLFYKRSITNEKVNPADSLPDWTIKKFVTEIENFFNVRFDVDVSNKTLNIINKLQAFNNIKTINVTSVIDDYDRVENEQDINVDLGFDEIKYNISSDGEYKYLRLSDEIKSSLKIVEFATKSLLLSHNFSTETINAFKLFRDLENDCDYVYIDPQTDFPYITTNDNTRLQRVNKLDNYTDNNVENTLELNIVPAAFTTSIVELFFLRSVGNPKVDCKIQVPDGKYVAVNELNSLPSLADVINGQETIIKRPSIIEVAVYAGLTQMPIQNTTISSYYYYKYPWSYIDGEAEFGYESNEGDSESKKNALKNQFDFWKNNYYIQNCIYSLRLKSNLGIVKEFGHTKRINMSDMYTLYLGNKINVSTNYIMLINNQKYIPVSIKKRVSEKEELDEVTALKLL